MSGDRRTPGEPGGKSPEGRGEPRSEPSLVRLGAVFGLVLLGALLLLKVFSDRPGLHPGAADAELYGATAESSIQRGGLVITGWADQRQVHQGDTITLWLTAVNRGTEEVRSLRLVELDTAGFVPSGDCWPQGCRAPGCVPICRLGEAEPGSPVGDALAPSKGADFRGDLRADAVKTGDSISVVFEWTTDGGPERAALFVGPFRTALATGHSRALAGSIYEFFKDLGLPIALGLLAYLFQRLQAVGARRDQTYDSMLPRAHDNAVRHLIPMSSAAAMIDRAIVAAGTARKAGKVEDEEVALRRAFYYLILLLQHNATLVERGGGYFLASLEGEQVAAGCWNVLFRRVVNRLDYAALSRILDGFDLEDSMTRFEGRFCVRHSSALGSKLPSPEPRFSPVFTGVRDEFRKWAGEERFDDEVRRLLRLYSSLVQLEVNRLYHLWYGEQDRAARKTVSDEVEAIPWSVRAGRAEASPMTGDGSPAVDPGQGDAWNVEPRAAAGTETEPAVSDDLIRLEEDLRRYVRSLGAKDRFGGGWLAGIRLPSLARSPDRHPPAG